MRIELIVALFCLCGETYAIQNCCPKDNIIRNDRCSEGSKPNLKCSTKVLIDSTTEKTKIDENGNLLLFEESTVPPEKYCKVYKLQDNISVVQYAVCVEQEEQDDRPLFLVVLKFMSVIFLVITVGIYIGLPYLMDLEGACIIHSVASLALCFLLLGIIQFVTIESNTLCIANGTITYFAFMYTFFWTNILSFHKWRTVVKPQLCPKIKKWVYVYHVYGILGPTALLVFLLIGIHGKLETLKDIHPGFGEGVCWFSRMKTQFIYFYGPIAFLICLNIIFYLWTVIFIWKEIRQSNEKKRRILIFRLKLCIKLFIVMGLAWIFEILSAVFTHEFMSKVWLVTDTINASEGILIFLILVVFRKRVLRDLANKSFLKNCVPNKWKHLKDEECDDFEQCEEEELPELTTPE